MLVLTSALLCISGTIVAQKFILLSGIPVTAFVMLRTLVPGCLITFKHCLGGKAHELQELLKLPLFAMACVTTFFPLLLKNLAHKHMSSAKFALLGSVDPLITCFLASILLEQKIRIHQYVGIGLASSGTIILSWHKIPSEKVCKLLFGFSWPEISSLMAIALGRLGWVACQKLIKNKQINETQANIIFMFYPGILALLVATGAGQATQLAKITAWHTWLTIAISVLLNTTGCILMTKSLKKFSAVTISLAGTCIVPLTVAISSSILYSESLSPNLLVSGILILTGMVIFNLEKLTAKQYEFFPKQSKPHFKDLT